jgi:invasion protein IalB
MKNRFLIATLVLGVSALAAAAAIVVSPAVSAQSNSFAMLEGLTKGEWTIKHRDGSADRKVCVRTGQELIQLRHSESGCSQFVVEDAAARVTVQYTCPGNGYGRTSIRRETPALVQIESQGIAGGLPFQFAAEARRTGAC